MINRCDGLRLRMASPFFGNTTILFTDGRYSLQSNGVELRFVERVSYSLRKSYKMNEALHLEEFENLSFEVKR